MKLLVTGAGGGLGHELRPTFAGAELVLLTREDLDITDAAACRTMLEQHRPDVVIHCAAYTKVDAAETEEAVAFAVNATGSANVADAAAAVGAVLVYPSTDYVFDGQKGAPYVETDTAEPLSAYGRSKLAGEQAVLAANPKSYVVRTSWLYSHVGKSFVTTIIRLLGERDSLSVVADETSAPTYAPHFAAALQQLLGTGHYGVYHLSGAGETSWHGFATEIAAQTESSTPVEQTSAAAYGLPARRPAYSKLDGSKAVELGITLPSWQEGLADFLRDAA